MSESEQDALIDRIERRRRQRVLRSRAVVASLCAAALALGAALVVGR